MNKKVVYSLVSLILITGLIVTYFYLSNFKNYKNNITIKAVPTDAAIIFQIKSPLKAIDLITEKLEYTETLCNSFDWFQSFNLFLHTFQQDPIFNSSSTKKLLNRPLTISLHNTGNENINSLFLIPISNKAEQSEIINFIENEITSWNISKRKYNSTNIYELNKKNNEGAPYYLSFYEGILLLGKSTILIENSLRQLRTKFSLLEDKVFAQLYKTSGNNTHANAFINFSYFPDLLRPTFNQNSKTSIDVLRNLSDWAELDINLYKSNTLINGFINSSNQNKLYKLFKGINPNSSRITEVIPDNNICLLSYSYDSSQKLKQNYIDYLNTENKGSTIKTKIEDLNLDLQFNEAINKVFSIIEEEFALVFDNAIQQSVKTHTCFIAKTKSKSKTQDLISKLNSQSIEPYSYYEIDSESRHPIYKNKAASIIPYLLELYCKHVPSKYYTYIDNYIVFSDTEKSLHSFIYHNVLNKTLNENDHYRNFTENFSYKDNIFIYCKPSELSSIFETQSNFSILNPNKEQKKTLNEFYGLGIQIANNNELFYTNISFQHNPMQSKEPQTIWQSGLDSTVNKKPTLVLNHYTKEKEILVQDNANKLYLISNSGRVLWKKQIEEPILSEIHQIDYYRNNKLQYLFNTANKIYLLDRNGNNVDKYPILLANQATNGLALFDYDNNRNYRIFIACSDFNTYVFNKSGKKITGWKFNKSEGIISKPIQHFRVQGKDYIVFSDDKRNYILNRKGQERVKIKNDFITNNNSLFYLEINNGEPYLLTSDRNCNARKINLNTGVTSQVELISSNDKHQFIASNIDKSQSLEYILLTKNNLMVFNNTGSKLFKTSIDGNILPQADIYQFSSVNKKIGVYDNQNHQIFLYNNNGSIYKDFPLSGKSRFSIGFLEQNSTDFNLIVGGENNFLYNYKVN